MQIFKNFSETSKSFHIFFTFFFFLRCTLDLARVFNERWIYSVTFAYLG